jgi:hypothetical protein
MAGNTVRVGVGTTGVGKASSDLDNFRDKFDKLQKQGAKGFAIGVGAAATTAALDLVGNAAGAVADQIGQSIDAASNLREAMSLSGQVFEGNADKMAAWAATADTAFGQSQREALEFAANFGTAFKNVGMDLDETADKAQTMTRLAADLGSAFNASSEEAATALRSGLLGESEPLRRFGVFLDEAKVKAQATAMGMKPLNGALTDGQKVAARYAIIMKQTADSQGMFGRDTDSLADAQKSLDTAFENLQASIGQDLAPVMKDFVVFLREQGIPAVKGFTDAVGFLVGGTDEYSEALANLNRKKFLAALATEAGVLGDASTQAAEDVKGAAFGIGSSFENMGDTSEDASDKVVSAVEDVTDAFEEARGKWTDAGQGAADAFWDPQLAKMELAANQRESRETRSAIKSGKLKDKELAEAKLHLAELNKTEMEMLATLASFGDKKAASTLADMIAVAKASGKLSKEQIAWFDKLEKQINDTSQAARNLANAIASSKTGKGNNKRASGGPVEPNQIYTVGEEGPETLVMGSDGGYVIPNGGGGGAQMPAMARAGLAAAPMAPALGSTTRIIQIVLDRRVLAEAIDTENYWAGAVAGGSTLRG